MGETNGETYGEASCSFDDDEMVRGDAVAFLRDGSPVLEASERPLSERAIVVAASSSSNTSKRSPGGLFELSSSRACCPGWIFLFRDRGETIGELRRRGELCGKLGTSCSSLSSSSSSSPGSADELPPTLSPSLVSS